MERGGADLLILGGEVVRSAGSGPAAPADIAVRNGVVVAVGSGAQQLRASRTQMLDVSGATVVPGLVDGHSHPVMGLDLVDSTDLTACRTLTEVAALLAAQAERSPIGSFLLASGLDPNVFGTEPLDNEAIGRAVGQRPALVHLFDGHAAIATDAALAAAGITGGRVLAGGADIVVDRTGAPTGLLLEEAAIDLVARLVPLAPFAERRQRLADLLSTMASTGLTGAHVMDAKGDATALFTALDERDDLPLRLRVAPWCRPGDGVEELLGQQRTGGRMWRIDGVKMFLDGTIDGGTAWLSVPDSLGGSTAPGWDPAEFRDRLRTFHRAGVPVAVHAIGDRAVRFVLDSIAGLDRPADGPRHRIEHAETMPDDLVPRFAALGVAASMQPRHATDYTRADGSDNWSRRLGRERAAQGWRCADVVRAGGDVVLGSDWPVAPFDARLTMAAAITRRPPGVPGLRSGAAAAGADAGGGVARLHDCAGPGRRRTQRTDRGRRARRPDGAGRRPTRGAGAPARRSRGVADRFGGPAATTPAMTSPTTARRRPRRDPGGQGPHRTIRTRLTARSTTAQLVLRTSGDARPCHRHITVRNREEVGVVRLLTDRTGGEPSEARSEVPQRRIAAAIRDVTIAMAPSIAGVNAVVVVDQPRTR